MSSKTDKKGWIVYSPDEKLRSFCWITAWVHFCAAVAYTAVILAQNAQDFAIPRLITQTTQNLGIWVLPGNVVDQNSTGLKDTLNFDVCAMAPTTPAKDSTYVVQQIVLAGTGDLDTRVLIVVFHFLSFVFQGGSAYSEGYYKEINNGRTNFGHFIEYSFSASILLVAMSAQFGITDLYLLMSMAANCWGCMMFGLMAEMLIYSDIKLTITFNKEKADDDKNNSTTFPPKGISIMGHWIAHGCGWFLLLFALVAASSNLIVYDQCAKTSKIPSWIQVLIGVESFLFICFGFVQLYSFRARSSTSKNIEVAKFTEFMYILLSVTAKITLGIFVIVGNLVTK